MCSVQQLPRFHIATASRFINTQLHHALLYTCSSEWNKTALLAAFRRGLNPSVSQQMAIYEDSVGLESFLQKAAHVSQHLSACHMEIQPAANTSPELTPPAPEGMITKSHHLSRAKRA
ncbi:hypothetical protein QQF64_004430 [Cirrhinus molitorella]|uniref:Uncharacterized protein n=1 Tax=Cirrhinus molitorella TaxID=172907 RepID=A0ABR3MGH7_9TELE